MGTQKEVRDHVNGTCSRQSGPVRGAGNRKHCPRFPAHCGGVLRIHQHGNSRMPASSFTAAIAAAASCSSSRMPGFQSRWIMPPESSNVASPPSTSLGGHYTPSHRIKLPGPRHNALQRLRRYGRTPGSTTNNRHKCLASHKVRQTYPPYPAIQTCHSHP